MTDKETAIANLTYPEEAPIYKEYDEALPALGSVLLDDEAFPDLESVLLADDQISIADGINTKNVLIVEDDQYIAKEYGYLLTAYGFKVSYAFDAEQAVKIIYLYGESLDFIVLDIRMYFGKYLTAYDTSEGSRTGSILSAEMREYALDCTFIALTNSNDAHDEAWFSANERHHFCRKDKFTPELFAKYVHTLSIESDSPSGSGDVEDWKEQLQNLLIPERNLTIQIIREQTMGDKYEAGQVGAQGKQAHAHDMVFNQIWEQNKSEINLNKLSTQLAELREAMATKASTQQDYIDIGNIASAEIEASNGNGSKALEYLKKTGSWTLATAEKIGVGVAVAAIKTTLGM